MNLCSDFMGKFFSLARNRTGNSLSFNNKNSKTTKNEMIYLDCFSVKRKKSVVYNSYLIIFAEFFYNSGNFSFCRSAFSSAFF